MRQKLLVYVLWIFTVVRVTKIKIVALVISSILSTYLFVSPHTYVTTKWGNIKRIQSVSIKDAFLHYVKDSEKVYGIAGLFLGLPFLIIFYPMVLIIQSNSEKKWIRVFYILQGVLLFYFAWYIMQFNMSWIALPVLRSDEIDVIVNFKLMLIQILSIGVGIWSLVKGILPRLSFDSE